MIALKSPAHLSNTGVEERENAGTVRGEEGETIMELGHRGSNPITKKKLPLIFCHVCPNPNSVFTNPAGSLSSHDLSQPSSTPCQFACRLATLLCHDICSPALQTSSHPAFKSTCVKLLPLIPPRLVLWILN